MKDSVFVVCDTAKVRFFKQITTNSMTPKTNAELFAILQKYDFSSKSQLTARKIHARNCCLRYCKSTIFQANHNQPLYCLHPVLVVCDTAKVRFFKQITTGRRVYAFAGQLFAILQKYDFSSKSQRRSAQYLCRVCCLRYCKSTIFQANHNEYDKINAETRLFAILQKYDFSSKSQQIVTEHGIKESCLRYCKSTIFQANHNVIFILLDFLTLFAILQKYDFSSKSQPLPRCPII